MKRVPITVQRGGPDDTPRLETHHAPYLEGMSVLDALIWIRAQADPTLAFRHSCINANACKECLLRVNGKTAYACTARLSEAGVTVQPLANKTLIRDLVTDTVPPKEKIIAALQR